ncbi:MAG TPA: hypothetical protein VGA21_10285 [Cyclobacteriaceae bacterium]|jgi:hypothetical protein
MSFENRISLKISADDQTEITTAITTLVNKLGPHLKALSAEDRRQLVKMGDSNVPFVEKALDYALSNPEFAPPYLKVDELMIDVEGVTLLTNYLRLLEQMVSNLKDSITLAGSEAMAGALTYYNSCKQAAKMNVPNAKSILDDLAKRFKGQGRTHEEVLPEEPVQ